jgi:hypothetical protein
MHDGCPAGRVAKAKASWTNDSLETFIDLHESIDATRVTLDDPRSATERRSRRRAHWHGGFRDR